VSAGIYAALALHTLGQLISIYNWLRAATTVLTVLSLWGIRRKFPDLVRPFRVPGGRFGLWAVILLPIVMTYVTLRFSDPFAKKYGVVGLALGFVAYAVVWPFRKRAGKVEKSA
jgi:hypothetical protein